jgi:hypothetical protein
MFSVRWELNFLNDIYMNFIFQRAKHFYAVIYLFVNSTQKLKSNRDIGKKEKGKTVPVTGIGGHRVVRRRGSHVF